MFSDGEICVALRAEFPVEEICFHGNNKTSDELRFAIENSLNHFIADNEMELLETLGQEYNKQLHVMIRLNVEIEEVHTHEYVVTVHIAFIPRSTGTESDHCS